MSTQLLPHTCFPEPKLSFHPERLSDQEIHPLIGLLRFGPYSSGVIPDPIRIATIAPFGEANRLYDFLKQLRSSFNPLERREYLPKWPGFRKVFGVHPIAAGGSCNVELEERFDEEFRNSEAPHIFLAEGLLGAIRSMESNRSRFDVLFIYIPEKWESGFAGRKDEDFDLHDYLKASCAALGIPIQLVREDSALAYFDKASVMWRISLALYVKAGGVPWKLAQADSETAYIGISYAVRPNPSQGPRFITCCSQVFDAEGAGLEFVAYDAHDVTVRRDNPYLSRTEMFRVMTRSMDLYRRRHAGKSPRRVMVHKMTEFKPEEIDGCMEALHLSEAVDLMQIVRDIGWKAARINDSGGKRGKPAMFPISRGTLLPLGERDSLLWTHGDVEDLIPHKSYFQGSRSTPRPLRLVRHAGHGPWDDSAFATLALSKMNWNNDNLYDHLPVTLGYASILARVVKRMESMRSGPYQFRYFM